MAIWDDFGKKAGDSVKGLGSRAKEIAEVARLNGQMAVKRTEGEKLYAEIGKAYCAVRTGADEDEKLKQLCRDAAVIQADLEDLQRQLDVLHKVRRCAVCGEVSSSDSKFCGSCGSKFEVETAFAEKAVIVPETIKIDIGEAPAEEAAEAAAETEPIAAEAPVEARFFAAEAGAEPVAAEADAQQLDDGGETVRIMPDEPSEADKSDEQ